LTTTKEQTYFVEIKYDFLKGLKDNLSKGFLTIYMSIWKRKRYLIEKLDIYWKTSFQGL
jgi:hypothetical protein